MRKRDKLKLLERVAEEFRKVNHIKTRGDVEACVVWYRPGESINSSGIIVGAGSDKFYKEAERYLVRWDNEKRLPAPEVIDNRLLTRKDLCLVRSIEYAISEVLNYIHSKYPRSR
jgi:hypothetical protein